ncbi:DNA binding protein [Aureococcus anophagefferens]|nr:DNA binding protein [Aureococcus anophagefferens]
MSDADKSIVRWSEDGSKMVIADPARFAAEFHKVPGSPRVKVVRFAHAHFREGKPEELRLVHRKGARPEEDSRRGAGRAGRALRPRPDARAAVEARAAA